MIYPRQNKHRSYFSITGSDCETNAQDYAQIRKIQPNASPRQKWKFKKKSNRQYKSKVDKQVIVTHSTKIAEKDTPALW